jgi:hypothetical protein
MVWRTLTGGVIAALAGAAMLATVNVPSDAFTLESPSLEPPVAAASVEPAYWHGGWHRGWGWHRHWGWRGGWHRWGYGYGGWHRWGWGPRWGYGYGYGFGPVYRCWWSAWGWRRCGWV